MHRLLLALLLTLCLARPALSGAWMREEGEWFLSFGGNVALSEAAQRPVHYDPTAYLEYGLTPGLTLGLDGYVADAGDAGSVFAFARLPLATAALPERARLAFSLGAGATIIPTGEIEPSARLGLSFGYGLDSGWLAADAEVVQALGGSDRRQSKLDLTWGYRLGPDWTSILSAQVGTGLEGDFYAKVTPSIAWRMTERVQLRVGATHALTGDRGTGLLMQVWTTF